MAQLIARIGAYSVRLHDQPWETLFSAVVYQQLSGAAAKRICDRIRSGSGGPLPSPKGLLDRPVGWLRQFGLTSRKEETLRTAAALIESNELNLDSFRGLPDESIVDRLTALRGIGPWTASMFLVFHLGRPDVIMPGDLGLRKAIQVQYALHRLPTEPEVEEKSALWSPYRTVASWYLWKSLPGFPEPGFG